jgi:hypothetical protein
MRGMICLGLAWLILLGGAAGCGSKPEKDKDSGQGTAPKRSRVPGADKDTMKPVNP